MESEINTVEKKKQNWRQSVKQQNRESNRETRGESRSHVTKEPLADVFPSPGWTLKDSVCVCTAVY